MIFLAGGNAYTLAHEHKNGWNAEAFKERFSEVLERYDYIVGDWGYSQLRLRGFYQEGHPRATKETTIASVTDYLNEYCNFGCAYFVLAKTDAQSVPPGTPDLTRAPDTLPAADGETDAQTAETAAASAVQNGILMRWPLKERPGGPVRMPGAAAVARAAAEAERRNQQANAHAGSGDGRGAGRQGSSSDGGFGGKQGGRPYSGGADKRSSGGNSSDGRNGVKGQAGRGPKPHSSERQGGGPGAKSGGQWRQPPDGGRSQEQARPPESGGARTDAAKNASRWPGKNRRRNRFGGKPNRPDGAGREGGAQGKPGTE